MERETSSASPNALPSNQRGSQSSNRYSNSPISPVPSPPTINSNQITAQPVSSSPSSDPKPLHYFMQVLKSTLADETDNKWELEDPDLMPNMHDFILCQAYFTKSGTRSPLYAGLDAEMFLNNYFQLSAAVRLTFCAFAAHDLSNETLAISYYKRARKALARKPFIKPSLELVQTYTCLFHFAINKGQPVIALQFLRSGLQSIRELKLDVDPDDSPWLYSLNLSERRKEERRRTFWQIFWHWSWQRALSDEDIIDFPITSVNVKPPSQVFDPLPIFPVNAVKNWECCILNLMGDIKRRYMIPPRRILDLLASEDQISLGMHLVSTQSSIPATLLLISAHPDYVSVEEEKQFLTATAIQDRVSQLNFIFQATTIIFYRPILFLSSLPSFNPNSLDENHRQIIAGAIAQCLQAARRILSFVTFFQDVLSGVRGSHQVLESERWCYDPVHNPESLMESILVIWFISCRMKREWWAYLSIPPFDTVTLQSSLERALDIIKKQEVMEGSMTGLTNVFTNCVQAMLMELANGPLLQREDGIQELEIGMRVMALGGALEDLVEPWAFLGLLGMELPGGIRWKGRSEESWRLFWKLNG